jgi:hypothetical protein
VIVQANLESNFRLFGTRYDRQLIKMKAAKAAGLKVVPGSDGLGILGPSASFESQNHAVQEMQKNQPGSSWFVFDTIHSSGHLSCVSVESVVGALAGKIRAK